ncbi:MarR family transcriptional regulator [Bradyrhizobium yuanmingense]|uniref:MarR family transcriptional regulator n=1 Tax=Bradyrhizobium yuanmingense TaxID=108015 RepID=UPI001CD7C13D|nr:helix-turn-helix domain-containing protein [Bradyrhizobium yuanmingense]MCA1524266.1 helix-turn-helix domain-containing protein [Bradyrhizobium yuanmingense]
MVAERHRQSAVVGRLLVSAFMAMRRGYSRKHIGAVFEELLVAMMIRVSDDLGSPPRTIADISKYLGLPRSNVVRCLDALVGEGVIIRDADGGFTGKEDYLAARVDAEYFERVCEAIITAADELRQVGEAA